MRPCGVFADPGVMTIGDTTVDLAVTVPLPFMAFAVMVQEVIG